MSSSLSFYALSARYILRACASLGAMLVTPHFFEPSATILTRNNLRMLLGLAKGCLCFVEPWCMPEVTS